MQMAAAIFGGIIKSEAFRRKRKPKIFENFWPRLRIIGKGVVT